MTGAVLSSSRQMTRYWSLLDSTTLPSMVASKYTSKLWAPCPGAGMVKLC